MQKTEEFRISTDGRGLTTVTEGTRTGHGLKVEEEGHDRQPERRVARCGEFTGRRPSTPRFKRVHVTYFVTPTLSLLLNLRFGIFLLSLCFVDAFANFHEFCCRAWTKIGTNGWCFFFRFFFFFSRIIRLACDEFCRWIGSWNNRWTCFKRFGLSNILNPWDPWLELIYYQCVCNVSLRENEFRGYWIVFEKGRCRCALFWEIRDNPSFHFRAIMQLALKH